MSHFDVNDTEPRVQYTATAGQTAFAIPFEFIANTDILVYQTLSGATPDDATDILILTTHYTLTGAGVTGGGTMTLVTGAAVNDTITIARDMAIQRKDTDYQDNGDFLAETVNTDIDRAILGIQQLESTINNRMLKLQRSTNTSGLDTTIPSPVAGKVIGFNGTADAIVLHDSPATLAGAAYTSETQTATASQTVFTLLNISYTPGIRNLSVYINGVRQSTTAYAETDANTVTFTAGLDAGDEVQFVSSDVVSNTSSNADTTTYDQGGAGSVATNVGAKLREVISVKDFGAVGNGTTDDSAAIQAALDAANAAGGGTVYFPPGTYRKLDTTSKLVMYSNTRILGDGWSSIILHDDTDVNARKDLIEAINRTNIEFENICFDGTWDTYPNQTNQSQCLVVQDTTGVRLTNVKFTRLRYMACPFTNVRNVTVTGCYLDQIARDGIRCVNSQNVVIDGNNFRNVADDVIALHVNDSDGTPTHAHGFIISNNTFEQCQGIKALGAKQLTITGNVFKRTIRNPILVTHSTGATEGDTTPWGVSITNNTFIDTFSDYGTVYVIRIETPERASAAQPIPGYPHTGTGVGNAPYSDFYTNELDTTVLGMYHTVISGNTIMRTLHATTNFSDYGFDTLLFDRVAPIGPGFGDPAINDTSFNCHHIHLIGNLRGVLIKGNTLSGIRSSTNAIAFSDPGTALTNGYENVSIESNLFFDVTGSAIVFSSAFNTITLDVTIKNNDFNLDPFHVDTDRAANGTWSAVNATQCVALNGCDGVTFSGNKIRNAARVADSVSNFSVKHRNLVYADFSSGGAGDNANNAGVRDIPASYPEFVIISYDADPTSGTFGEVSNNELLEASAAMPSTGSYVASHFVRNETPTVTGTGGSQYVVSGWIRITTNSAHVLNTDWVEARTLTGT